MNIISKYFDFKKKSLVSYAMLLLGEEGNGKRYIEAFIETFIDTYYYHILNTYYENAVSKYNDKIIIKEIKGKMLELLDEIKDKDSIKEEKQLIAKCYKLSFVSIVICLNSFSSCHLVDEYKTSLKELLNNNKSIDVNNNELMSSLASLLKKNTDKERKFFTNLKSPEFQVFFAPYKESKENYKVSLEYSIDQLEKNYTRQVLDKNFGSDVVALNRLKVTISNLNYRLLKMILSNEKMHYYFVDLPLGIIKDREELEDIISSVDNIRIKERVVFVVNYNEYINNKSLFKNLGDYSFAICIDLSRTIVIEKRLAELETFDLFGYILIDGVKKENRHLVENYVIKGKEMFMNELNMM